MTTRAKNEITLLPSHVAVFNFIDKYIEKNTFSPEVEEVAKGIKLTPRHTYRIVDDLCALGHLSKLFNRKRSLKIEKPLK
jgi:hypothetical protein